MLNNRVMKTGILIPGDVFEVSPHNFTASKLNLFQRRQQSDGLKELKRKKSSSLYSNEELKLEDVFESASSFKSSVSSK